MLRFAQEVHGTVAAKSADSGQRYREFREKYRDDPEGFARDCVKWDDGEGLRSYQGELLSLLSTRDRVSWRGPRGSNKTTTVALAILWFALTRDEHPYRDWKIGITASVERQLTKYLWPEVQFWSYKLRWDKIGRAPYKDGVELQGTGLYPRSRKGFAVCFVSNDENKLEGLHARDVMLVIDECKAVPDASFRSLMYGLSGSGGARQKSLVVAASTPGPRAGWFYDLHSGSAQFGNWLTRHITQQMAIDAGALTVGGIEELKQLCRGEETAEYKRHGLGEFADDDIDGLIKLEWVEQAVERWYQWKRSGEGYYLSGLGWDVAAGGKDRTIIAPCYGGVRVDTLFSPQFKGGEERKGSRTADEKDFVANFLDSNDTDEPTCVVDAIGVGDGPVSELEKLREVEKKRWTVDVFKANETVPRKTLAHPAFQYEHPKDRKTAAWMVAAWMLDPDNKQNVCLPDDPMLKVDLVTPQRITMANMVVKIETKDEIRKRIHRSTDRGDAVVMILAAGKTTRQKRVARGCYPSLTT